MENPLENVSNEDSQTGNGVIISDIYNSNIRNLIQKAKISGNDENAKSML